MTVIDVAEQGHDDEDFWAGGLSSSTAVPPAEYCPVSIGAKLLGDRWTLLIIRELMTGSTGFNQIHRGLPGLNRSVLSDRLRHLERLRLIERVPVPSGPRRLEYVLTDAGHALKPVILAIGAWTIDWRFPCPTDEQSDVPLILWRMFQGLDREVLPDRQISIEFRFPGTDPSRGWIHVDDKSSGACVGAPEREVDLIVTTQPRILCEAWYGYRTLSSAICDGLIALEGQPRFERDFPRWFTPSPFAIRVQELRGSK